MTSFGMSDMFSRIMWGIGSAESLIRIRSVCVAHGYWRVGLAKDGHPRVKVLRALVPKGRVQPHLPFSRHRARKLR
jgi:hypothetical protein